MGVAKRNNINFKELDYYPFGSEKPGRSFASGFYQYSVNGQEKIDEISGEGNHNTAQFWEYDTRLGRRWNLDPKPVTSISSYSAFMNNPIVFSDVFGDTSQYYNMKTNELLGTINNSGSLMRYKVDASDYNFYTGDVYSGKDLSNQTNANSFVTGLNAFSQANETTLGGNRFAAETGIEMKFSGNSAQSNTIINQASINNGNAKPIYSNGTLTTNALFDDGSKIQLQTLSARSGPWGNSSLPNGTYSASSIVNTAESGMLRNGVGFKVILSNNTAYSRTSLRIHPDQEPQPGSSGCIGLVAGANDLNQFRKIVRNYFSSHNNTSFNVIVNINGNPNYSGNGSANLLGE